MHVVILSGKFLRSVLGVFLLGAFAVRAQQPNHPPVVGIGESWRYWNREMAPTPGWKSLEYNDSIWTLGTAQLGYGDGDEATVTRINPPPHPATAYFRKLFTLGSPAQFAEAQIRLLRDDGAVVYINGVEVLRDGMPPGEVGHNTLAVVPAGEDENTPRTHLVNILNLLGHTNVIAVEVHQVAVSSSDMSFDLELRLTALPVEERAVISILATQPNTSEPLLNALVAPGEFTVFRADPHLDQTLNVYLNYSGTASPADYEPLPIAVLFPAGSNTVRIPVLPKTDGLVEGPESVVAGFGAMPVEIHDPSSPNRPYIQNFSNYVAEVTIQDADSTNQTNVSSIRINQPQDGAVFQAGQPIQISATAIDPNGYIARLEFFANNLRIGVSEINYFVAPPPGTPIHHSIVWSNAPVGRYEVAAVGVDSLNQRISSPPIHLVVTNIPRPAPVVGVLFRPFHDSVFSGGETATGMFEFYRFGETNEALQVFFDKGGTATSGVDYVSFNNYIVFAPGRSRTNMVVSAIDDQLLEGVETVVVELKPAPLGIDSQFPTYYVINPTNQSAIVPILDDEGTNSQPRVVIIRPADGSHFATGVPISIEASAVDSAGYIPFVDFFAGDKLIGTSRIDFIVPPPPGTPLVHSIVWSNAPAGAQMIRARGRSNRDFTVESEQIQIIVGAEERLTIAVEAVDSIGREALTNGLPDNAHFRISRVSGPLNQPVNVRFILTGSATYGIDYQQIPTTVTLSSNEPSRIVAIAPIRDNLVEGNESVVLTLTNCALIAGFTLDPFAPFPDCYDIAIGKHRAEIVIRDGSFSSNQPPRVTITAPLDGSEFQHGERVHFRAEASDSDGQVVQINMLMDGRVIASTNTFILMNSTNPPVGEHTFLAIARDDDGATNVSQRVLILIRGTNEPLPVVSLTSPVPETVEGASQNGGALGRFRVSRSGSTAEDLVVRLHYGGSATPGVDYNLLPNTVRFDRGASETNVLVFANEDGVTESSETVIASLLPDLFPAPAGLRAWWTGDGHADDISGFNNHGIPQNIVYAEGKEDSAFVFNGTNSYIRVGGASSLVVTSFTFTAWIYPENLSWGPIIEYGSSNETAGVHLWVGAGDGVPLAGSLLLNVRDAFGANRSLLVPNVIPANQWSFVSGTFDQASGVAKLYLNGDEIDSRNFGSLIPRTDRPLAIGRRHPASLDAGAGSHFQGRIDEVQIYGRALTETEVDLIYDESSSQFCAPEGLRAWWSGDAHLNDLSGNLNHPDNYSIDLGRSGISDGAFYFNGTNSFFSVPPSSSLAVESFTFTAWINPEDASHRPILEYGEPHEPAGVHLWVGAGSGTPLPGSLLLNVRDADGVNHSLVVPNVIRTNEWAFVSGTFDQASGIANLYLNGNLIDSGNFGSYVPRTDKTVTIGRRHPLSPEAAAGSYFQGLIDEVEIYGRALSQAEIMSIYDDGTYGCRELAKGGFNGPSPSEYLIDPTNHTATVVIVDRPPPSALVEIILPKNRATFPQGSAIAIEATAFDSNGLIRLVEFYAGPTQIGVSEFDFEVGPGTRVFHSMVWSNAPAGDHTLIARGLSSTGVTIESNPIHISVVRDTSTNQPPVVLILMPHDGAVFEAGDRIHYRAEGSDPDGQVVQVKMLMDGRVIASTNTFILMNSTNPPPGEHTLLAIARDDDGATNVSQVVRILVRGTNNLAFFERRLPAGFTPGTPFTVRIQARVPSGTQAWGVEDQPPQGWTVSSISDGGTFDAATGKVKFGYFIEPGTRTLSYVVRPVAGDGGTFQFVGTFTGVGSIDGRTYPILGQSTVSSLASEFHPADRNEDRRIALAEVTGYAAAWKLGETWSAGPNPIPASYVTRAGLIWRQGEAYRFAATNPPPFCWISLAGREGVFVAGSASTATRSISGGPEPSSPRVVTLEVEPAASVTAYNVEERVPEGWTVQNITGDGVLDPVRGVVRWGLYLDSDDRTLSYQLVPPAGVAAGGQLLGEVTLDGEVLTFAGADSVVSVDPATQLRLQSTELTGDGGVKLKLGGAASQVCVLESSTDLASWEFVAELFLPGGELEFRDSDVGETQQRYYRLRAR